MIPYRRWSLLRLVLSRVSPDRRGVAFSPPVSRCLADNRGAAHLPVGHLKVSIHGKSRSGPTAEADQSQPGQGGYWRRMAARYGGGPNSIDWRHFGRLAGFTNRKPLYVDKAGRYPFIRIDESTTKAGNYVNSAPIRTLIAAGVQRLNQEKHEQCRRAKTSPGCAPRSCRARRRPVAFPSGRCGFRPARTRAPLLRYFFAISASEPKHTTLCHSVRCYWRSPSSSVRRTLVATANDATGFPLGM